MEPDLRLFQIYLLSMMRATGLVQQALGSLSADATNVELAREAMRRLGLEEVSHPMTAYTSLLSAVPLDLSRGIEPRSMRSARFQLPVWADFEFVVYGDRNGTTTERRFERPQGSAPPRIADVELRPWHVVEDDLQNAAFSMEVVDEWYPMKDFRCTVSGLEGKPLILRFDLGLLQAVERDPS